jgi:hypothetical protein
MAAGAKILSLKLDKFPFTATAGLSKVIIIKKKFLH